MNRIPVPLDVSTDFAVCALIHDFNAPHAGTDIVLISGDKPLNQAKSFYAHRSILALASPFFRDMFTLPQPPPRQPSPSSSSYPTQSSSYSSTEGQRPDVDANGIPCIHVTETHTVLSLLLHLVYPFPKPAFNPDTVPMGLFSELLGAVTKYDLYFPLSYLRSVLISPEAGYLTEDATRVYAVACRHNLETEAHEAMKWVVKTGMDVRSVPLREEWKLVSAWEYKKLDDWVRDKRNQVGDLVARWYSVNAEERELMWESDRDAEEVAQMPKCMQCNGPPQSRKNEPKWWTEFVKRVTEKQGVGIGGTDGMFDMLSLADVVKDCGCPRCAGSVMTSVRFLQELQNCVDRMIDEEGSDGS